MVRKHVGHIRTQLVSFGRFLARLSSTYIKVRLIYENASYLGLRSIIDSQRREKVASKNSVAKAARKGCF